MASNILPVYFALIYSVQCHVLPPGLPSGPYSSGLLPQPSGWTQRGSVPNAYGFSPSAPATGFGMGSAPFGYGSGRPPGLPSWINPFPSTSIYESPYNPRYSYGNPFGMPAGLPGLVSGGNVDQLLGLGLGTVPQPLSSLIRPGLPLLNDLSFLDPSIVAELCLPVL